jgi:hypothetical protein
VRIAQKGSSSLHVCNDAPRVLTDGILFCDPALSTLFSLCLLCSVLGKVNIRVAVNGQQWSAQAVSFTYFPRIHVTNLLPSKGPINGNTLVLVHGHSFLQQHDALGLALCKFEQSSHTPIYIKATVVSANAVMYALALLPLLRSTRLFTHSRAPAPDDLPRCNTTREHALGMATVEVSANGVDFSTDGQNFEFVEVVISSVEPPSGPALGGTAVTVRGSNLDALISTSLSGAGTHSFKCAWGETISPASVTLSGMVQCSAPPIKDHGMLCTQRGLACSLMPDLTCSID